MECRNCLHECELAADMFYWRGRHFSGYVCWACNALYRNPDDDMFAYVIAHQWGNPA